MTSAPFSTEYVSCHFGQPLVSLPRICIYLYDSLVSPHFMTLASGLSSSTGAPSAPPSITSVYRPQASRSVALGTRRTAACAATWRQKRRSIVWRHICRHMPLLPVACTPQRQHPARCAAILLQSIDYRRLIVCEGCLGRLVRAMYQAFMRSSSCTLQDRTLRPRPQSDCHSRRRGGTLAVWKC